MNISDRTTAATLMTAITGTVDAKAPKAIINGYAEANRVAQAARALGAGPEQLSIAVFNALTAGRDPGADPEVQRVLVESQIGNEGVMRTAEAMAYDRFREVCLTHADATVMAWRKPFDQAVETLGSCFEKIGPVPLEDTGAIIARGGEIAAVWAEAQQASEVIDRIRTGWAALGQFTRTAQNDTDYRVLQLAQVSYADWTEHQLRRRALQPWQYLLVGLHMSLPTVAEYRQRVQVITEGMARAETYVDTERSAVAGREVRVPVGR